MSVDPPKPSRGLLVLAVLIITLGVGWLLTALAVGPGIEWVWTLGLGAAGVLTFVLSGGLDKLSVVFGPFLLVGSVLSIFRQAGSLRIDIEVPILVIVLGALLLIAQMPFVPLPRWFVPLPGDGGRG